MLGDCSMEDMASWNSHLPLIEFAHNNSYHYNIGMKLYGEIYIRKCRTRTPLCWSEVGIREYLDLNYSMRNLR